MPLALKNTIAHVPWFGRFRSLIIVTWDLPFDATQGGELIEPFEIWCLIFGFYYRVARII